MSNRTSAYSTDLGVATRAGLTRGGTSLGLASFAEVEMRYREERLIAEASRSRQARAGHTDRAGRFGREVMSRWTTWLPSVPLLHRSSPARASSSACGN
jgi:hypothetical protein